MEENQEKFKIIKEYIDKADNILLATHENADGDALGSSLALKYVLNILDKPSTFFCSHVPANLKFLPGATEIKNNVDNEVFDLIFGLDYGHINRLDLPETQRLAISNERSAIVTIDHHITNDQNNIIGIVDGNISSTSELLYFLIKFLNIEINKDIATCLLCGIFTDTGSLRHSSTTAQTLKVAADLLLKGAALNKIVKFIFDNSQNSLLKIWAYALNKLKFDEISGLAISNINYEELKKIGSNFDDLEGFSNLMNAIAEAKISLFLKEKEPKKIEGSLRSRDFDVANLAKKLGGGGHRLAAGFQTDKEMKEIVNKIKEIINEKDKKIESSTNKTLEKIEPISELT